MNDDLISRKELIERIAKQYDLQYGNNSFGRIIDCIKAQPAAYDAEYDKLKHYENLEEQGRLTILPCKVGDTIYTHVGSASSLIAYEEAKIPYTGFEKDPLMYQKSKKRLEEYIEKRKEENNES